MTFQQKNKIKMEEALPTTTTTTTATDTITTTATVERALEEGLEHYSPFCLQNPKQAREEILAELEKRYKAPSSSSTEQQEIGKRAKSARVYYDKQIFGDLSALDANHKLLTWTLSRWEGKLLVVSTGSKFRTKHRVVVSKIQLLADDTGSRFKVL